MTHRDFNQTDSWSYEQAVGVIHRLSLGIDAIEEQVRLAIFNVVFSTRNSAGLSIGLRGQWVRVRIALCALFAPSAIYRCDSSGNESSVT